MAGLGLNMTHNEADPFHRGLANRHYLLQRRIVPRQLNGLPVYFRVYVFASIWSSGGIASTTTIGW